MDSGGTRERGKEQSGSLPAPPHPRCPRGRQSWSGGQQLGGPRGSGWDVIGGQRASEPASLFSFPPSFPPGPETRPFHTGLQACASPSAEGPQLPRGVHGQPDMSQASCVPGHERPPPDSSGGRGGADTPSPYAASRVTKQKRHSRTQTRKDAANQKAGIMRLTRTVGFVLPPKCS